MISISLYFEMLKFKRFHIFFLSFKNVLTMAKIGRVWQVKLSYTYTFTIIFGSLYWINVIFYLFCISFRWYTVHDHNWS